ncbi:MAG: hypothetical protein L3J71_11980 [Victivallaceae bacterium]|nr:hypothetical protein [Victivallaceae bacterium]
MTVSPDPGTVAEKFSPVPVASVIVTVRVPSPAVPDSITVVSSLPLLA